MANMQTGLPSPPPNTIQLPRRKTIKVLQDVHVQVSELQGKVWCHRDDDLENYIESTKGSESTSFIFLNSTLLKQDNPGASDLHKLLFKLYHMPEEVWSAVHWESNGYFGCREDEHGCHVTWFRFLIKQLFFNKKDKPLHKNYSYAWYKLGFFSTWCQSGPKSILCMDCPDELVIHIRNSLNKSVNDHFRVDPYSFHEIVIRGVVEMYDNSVWRLRDVIREFEKAARAHGTTAPNITSAMAAPKIPPTHGVNQPPLQPAIPLNKAPKKKRTFAINGAFSTLGSYATFGANSSEETPKAPKPDINYDGLHEAARHVIHSTETLTVSTQLLEQIVNRQKGRVSLSEAPEEEKKYMRQIGDKLMFYHGMIHAFKCRSESMQARHQNEVSLAFNSVAQSHSQAAVVDAAAMRVIAALTAAFLPATFVSAVFSMSFFNNGGSNGPSTDAGDEGWSLSPKFWIYWAIAIPLTIITIVCLLLSKRIMKRLGMI